MNTLITEAETYCVLSEVGTGFLNIIQMSAGSHRFKYLYFNFLGEIYMRLYLCYCSRAIKRRAQWRAEHKDTCCLAVNENLNFYSSLWKQKAMIIMKAKRVLNPETRVEGGCLVRVKRGRRRGRGLLRSCWRIYYPSSSAPTVCFGTKGELCH